MHLNTILILCFKFHIICNTNMATIGIPEMGLPLAPKIVGGIKHCGNTTKQLIL
jgi:hypothetical protein